MRSDVGRRVLMLLENEHYPQDGRVRHEARALADMGFQVSVIAPLKRGQARYEKLDDVQVYRYPTLFVLEGMIGYVWEYGYALIATFLLSTCILFRKGFDLVHIHCPPDIFVVLGAFYKLVGKRLVYDQHDLSPEMYDARTRGQGHRAVHRVLLWVERLAYRLADHVIVTNESYKTVAQQRGHVPESRISIVRNGSELGHLRPLPPDPRLEQMDKTIIGYIGVIGIQDGVDYLLRSLGHLLHTLARKDFFCVIIGAGDAVPGLKVLCSQLGLNNHVLFTGWVEHDELMRYLSVVSIGVSPEPSNAYNDRSTMIKIMDYMALGKPIIAFDLPEHRFSAQAAALYARANDELDFALALARLIDSPAQRQAMGAFGRRRIESALAWKYSVPCLLHVYERVLPGTHTGSSSPAHRAIISEKDL